MGVAKRMLAVCLCALASLVATGWAEQPGAAYRGTYASDCSRTDDASITIQRGAIVLRTAGKGPRTLPLVEENVAFYGRTPPPKGFVTMLSVDAQPGKALNVEVFELGGTHAIQVTGHPDVERSLPASLLKGRVHRCK
jgi:hypothetical protein